MKATPAAYRAAGPIRPGSWPTAVTAPPRVSRAAAPVASPRAPGPAGRTGRRRRRRCRGSPMPSAPPNSLLVSMSADATPACSGGAAPRTSSVTSGHHHRRGRRVAHSAPTSSSHSGESGVHPGQHAEADRGDRRTPAPIRYARSTRCASAAAAGAAPTHGDGRHEPPQRRPQRAQAEHQLEVLGGEDGEADEREHRRAGWPRASRRTPRLRNNERSTIGYAAGPLPVHEERARPARPADDARAPGRGLTPSRGHLLDAVDHRQHARRATAPS